MAPCSTLLADSRFHDLLLACDRDLADTARAGRRSLCGGEVFTRACTRMLGCHLIEGAGHWVQLEQPEAVVRLLVEFVQSSSSH